MIKFSKEDFDGPIRIASNGGAGYYFTSKEEAEKFAETLRFLKDHYEPTDDFKELCREKLEPVYVHDPNTYNEVKKFMDVTPEMQYKAYKNIGDMSFIENQSIEFQTRYVLEHTKDGFYDGELYGLTDNGDKTASILFNKGGVSLSSLSRYFSISKGFIMDSFKKETKLDYSLVNPESLADLYKMVLKSEGKFDKLAAPYFLGKTVETFCELKGEFKKDFVSILPTELLNDLKGFKAFYDNELKFEYGNKLSWTVENAPKDIVRDTVKENLVEILKFSILKENKLYELNADKDKTIEPIKPLETVKIAKLYNSLEKQSFISDEKLISYLEGVYEVRVTKDFVKPDDDRKALLTLTPEQVKDCVSCMEIWKDIKCDVARSLNTHPGKIKSSTDLLTVRDVEDLPESCKADVAALAEAQDDNEEWADWETDEYDDWNDSDNAEEECEDETSDIYEDDSYDYEQDDQSY